MIAALQPGYCSTRDNEETRRLLREQSEAPARWREPHVARDSTAHRNPDLVIEVQDTHLTALHDWCAAEVTPIAARLGCSAQRLPER